MLKRECRLVCLLAVVALLALTMFCTSSQPPSVPTVSGPVSARAGDTLVFEFCSRDPEFGMVTYMVDWGDTTRQVWSPFFPSGDTVRRTHVYDQGVYRIRAKARDIDRAESDWSDYWEVEISP